MSIKTSNAGDPSTTATTVAEFLVESSATVDSSFEILALNSHAARDASETIQFISGFDRNQHISIDGDNSQQLPVQVTVLDSNGGGQTAAAATASASEHAYGVRITEEQSGDIKLRNLYPQDIPELKEVCSQWFPIEYPNFWYQDITSNKKFCSLVATHQNRIIGLIVADVKLKLSMDVEDRYILARKFPEATQLTYILSLGVLKEYRRLGIASLLLDTLIHHLNIQTKCKAVYLHVLSSNAGAIKFYEKRNFQRRAHLPKYYTINGQAHDGYTYVLYMNGGEPPLLFGDLLAKSWSKMKTLCNCDIACRLYIYMVDFFRHNHSMSRTKDQYRIS